MQTHNTNNRIKIHEQAKKKMPTKIHDKNAHALELRNAGVKVSTERKMPREKEWSGCKPKTKNWRWLRAWKIPTNALKTRIQQIFNVVFHLERRSFHFIVNCSGYYYYYCVLVFIVLTCLKLKTEIAYRTKWEMNEASSATSNANSINKCNLKWIAYTSTTQLKLKTKAKQTRKKNPKIQNKMSYIERTMPMFGDARTKLQKKRRKKKHPTKSRSDCNVATIRSNYVASLSSGNANEEKISLYMKTIFLGLWRKLGKYFQPKLKLMKRYLIRVREAFKRYF